MRAELAAIAREHEPAIRARLRERRRQAAGSRAGDSDRHLARAPVVRRALVAEDVGLSHRAQHRRHARGERRARSIAKAVAIEDVDALVAESGSDELERRDDVARVAKTSALTRRDHLCSRGGTTLRSRNLSLPGTPIPTR